jgi:putative membrane protein insertion efficiency factor/ribonuclease P protein component
MRISRGAEIKKILRQKQFHFTSPLLYFTGQDNKKAERILVICSKKLGSAVSRNRIRRQIVGWYIKNRHKIAKNIDMISPRSRIRSPAGAGAKKDQVMSKLIIYLLSLYKKTVSPLLGEHCRYYPSCSEYTGQAIEKHGAGKGLLFGIKRLIKCNQFFPGGFDPVPESVSRGTICSN